MNIKDKILGTTTIQDNNELKGICVGKGCNNIGTISAKILFIEKEALFCESCKQSLEKSGLISIDLGGR